MKINRGQKSRVSARIILEVLRGVNYGQLSIIVSGTGDLLVRPPSWVVGDHETVLVTRLSEGSLGIDWEKEENEELDLECLFKYLENICIHTAHLC